MKRIYLTTLVLCTAFALLGQLPRPVKAGKKLTVAFSKNIELLGFAYFIGFEAANIETQMVEVEGKKIPEKDWFRYGYNFYREYRQLAGSSNMAAALTAAGDLWLGDMIPLLLQVNDFPKAAITAATPAAALLPFSAKKDLAEATRNATLFLNACNAFYKEAAFDTYLVKNRRFYQAALTQLLQHLPNGNFIEGTERFYKTGFNSYFLLPSLTLPGGMGFGPRLNNNGFTAVYNVFGAVNQQQLSDTLPLDMGFGHTGKLRELSIHEFGHSFVNPQVYKADSTALQKTAVLFAPLQKQMEAQGYNTWKSCVIEHFVRAGEIAIARQMKDTLAASRLTEEYITRRQFVYIPLILEAMKDYTAAKSETFFDLVQRVMRLLTAEADR